MQQNNECCNYYPLDTHELIEAIKDTKEQYHFHAQMIKEKMFSKDRELVYSIKDTMIKLEKELILLEKALENKKMQCGAN